MLCLNKLVKMDILSFGSELENHTYSVAASIFNHQSQVVAGICIAGLEANYTKENIEIYAEKGSK